MKKEMGTVVLTQSEYDEIQASIVRLEALVKYYEEQFRLSRSRRFGPSSEISGQLGLFDEAENTIVPDLPEPELEEVTYTRRKRIAKREDDLSSLPVEVVEHTLPEEEQICPECGGDLHEMGHDTRRELKVIPAKVVVVEHNRAVYSCRNCEKNNDHVPIVKAPTPEPVIKGSLASPSAVAYIMAQKYVMCAPLYRQEKDWGRQGVTISRQTMANWVIRCAEDWLLPLYMRMFAILFGLGVIHMDETVVQVLREPGKAATTASYMWLYRTSGDADRHIVLFEYQPDRTGKHLAALLGEFKGIIHTDGYAVYHKLSPEITIVGCWVHLRRKFSDALKSIPTEQKANSVAQEAIRKLGYLFHLEELWQDLSPQERYTRRQYESKPLADAFFEWIQTLNVLPQSATGKAINYALNQRKWLMNVFHDGRAELSNNRIENSVRPFAIGRKNWLFCNTVQGAHASAVVYSIIETAKENGLKPFEYLEFLFETLPNTTTSGLDSLLPWGEAVPDHCRMSKKGGLQDAKTEDRASFHDGVRSKVS
ncbi:MAG: IS66 family transposase [Clostridiales bacterium]|nr:IS66 family transposase [Clostridiales bacterium]